MSADRRLREFGWFGIVRLGLVQAALGSVVVLVTSTLNRVMVVELALPASLPGLLVALHYAVQMVRPRFGFESDLRVRRAPWIVGGMALLALGGIVCAVATVLLGHVWTYGLVLALTGYSLVGMGVGAAGTTLLALVATRVAEDRRAPAVTAMWILMIAGFAITSTLVAHFLDPFSPQRLVTVAGVVATCALLLAMLALWGVEGSKAGDGAARMKSASRAALGPETHSFKHALKCVWAEPQARRFTLFVFMSMLAYSAQELLLEPFAGLVFGYSLGASAALSGTWHAAALGGMICVGLTCRGGRLGSLQAWTQFGCAASAAALLSLAACDWVGPAWPLRVSVIGLGFANGAFTVGAIGMMMQLAQTGGAGAGVRMGLWGAAQAIAFGCGGVLATALIDGLRYTTGSRTLAFALVFTIEASLFLFAAFIARRPSQAQPKTSGDWRAVSA